jgi:excisionase family DNA binding protein
MSKTEYLTVKELSEYIKVKPKTLYNWANSGKIPAYKVNGFVFFQTQEVDQFIKSKQIKPLTSFQKKKKELGKFSSSGHNQGDSGQNTSSFKE